MGTMHVAALVETVVDRLAGAYVFPDRAAAAAAALRANLAAGRYGDTVDEALCRRLSEDLLAVCDDRHLRLIWHPESGIADPTRGDEALVAELREMFRLENQGVRRVERLPGNVGLIELTLVGDAATAGRTTSAAMELVQHTHALVLDLRKARGGAPDGVAFWCSFLLDGEVHLNDVHEGPGPVRQYWTSGYVPGPRYTGRPVFVLISGTTFSGAEELAYDLQALGRATVVGEVSRGGAHPSEVVPIAEHVELRLPVARAVNPVTGGNWEGVGVQPDIRVPAPDALGVAHRAALEEVVSGDRLPTTSREEARAVLAASAHCES